MRFSSAADGSQTANLAASKGAGARPGTGDGGQVILEAAPVSTGRNARVTEAGGYRSRWLAQRSPSSSTRARVLKRSFTGDISSPSKDVCGVVLEVPNAGLGSPSRGLACGPARWTARAGSRRTGARPAQAVFLVGTERDAYLAGEPANDGRFVPSSRTRWNAPEEARRCGGDATAAVL